VKRYLVFDCLVLDKECLTNRPLDKRIGRFAEFVDKPLKALYKAYPEDVKVFPFEVKFKAMDKPYALETMFNEKLPNLPHGNDGLVFTCKGTTYVTGTDEHILKWKPAHENSIDFKLRLGDFPWARFDDGTEGPDYDAKPSFELLVYHGNKRYERHDVLTFTDHEWEVMKSLDEQLDGRIIECFRNDAGLWRFKAESNGAPRFRDDKQEANHISTVRKVLDSINDGVSQEELIAAAPRIQRAWKQRHPEEEAQKRAQMAQRGPPPVNGHMNGH
jgi:mRNA guanylyltransferase